MQLTGFLLRQQEHNWGGRVSPTTRAGRLNTHAQRRSQTHLLPNTKNLLQENNKMLRNIRVDTFFICQEMKMTSGISSNTLISAGWRKWWAADKKKKKLQAHSKWELMYTGTPISQQWMAQFKDGPMNGSLSKRTGMQARRIWVQVPWTHIKARYSNPTYHLSAERQRQENAGKPG